MEPSTRTPEGETNRCPVCGKPLQIEPSRPPGDAPCPHCGSLLWFGAEKRDSDKEQPAKQESGVLELVESARNRFDQEELAKQEAKLRKAEFTLDDFKKQLGQIHKLGPIRKIVSMIPGMGGMGKMLDGQNPEADLRRLVGIIDSMTPDERHNPSKTVEHVRRCRIAKGAGVEPREVDDLVRQFDGIADMMKKMFGTSILA
jgi:signal recognition particle GTPase